MSDVSPQHHAVVIGGSSHKNTCEAIRIIDGRRCAKDAPFLVQVGKRKTDAQLSCRAHLADTCIMMAGREERAGVSITVTVLRYAAQAVISRVEALTWT